MHILVVEDEDSIASFVVKGLKAEGHAPTRAATVADALALSSTHDWDIVLLDLLLPDGHGLEVLRSIRSANPDTAVIVLSALGEVDDKVTLLDAGADDYLVKPFAFEELLARIRANTRQGHASGRVLALGDLSLDTKTRRATRGDTVVDLPSREFALLEYFMRHPEQVLTRQQLLDGVWGIDFDPGTNVVDVYVGYLRRKLDRSGEPSVIETVRGAGYRIRG